MELQSKLSTYLSIIVTALLVSVVAGQVIAKTQDDGWNKKTHKQVNKTRQKTNRPGYKARAHT